jgi:hypothetical protein
LAVLIRRYKSLWWEVGRSSEGEHSNTFFVGRAGSNFLICYQFFTCGGATSPVPGALRGWQEKNTHARRVGVALWVEFNRDISYRVIIDSRSEKILLLGTFFKKGFWWSFRSSFCNSGKSLIFTGIIRMMYRYRVQEPPTTRHYTDTRC